MDATIRFPDEIGPRTQLAWDAILETLQDGEWHHHSELIHVCLIGSDLTEKSIIELIRKGWRTRHYERRVTKTVGTRYVYRMPADD